MGGVRARRLRRRAHRRRGRRVRLVRAQRVHVQERARQRARRRVRRRVAGAPHRQRHQLPRHHGCPTSSTCTVRASTCRRRAARRSWPCTSPARACSAASATSPSPAARSSRRCSAAATSTRRARSSRPTVTAGRSTPGRPARSSPAPSARSCSSRSPTPSTTATTCSPSSAARRSTTTGGPRSATSRPSVAGQAEVVTEALAVAGVDPRDVTYVEAHGTGTLIGDPIEVAGLTQAYRLGTDDTQFCAIGSLKSNIGHTGEAAGVGALIKTVLSLQHREIPPSLHFTEPNPQADFPNSPFFVNAALRPWEPGPSGTRIAGITGLGAGGTNAHLIVEEAPPVDAVGPLARGPAASPCRPARADGARRGRRRARRAPARRHPTSTSPTSPTPGSSGARRSRMRRAVVAATPLEAAEALDAAGKAVDAARTTASAPSVVVHDAGRWRAVRRDGPRAVRRRARLPRRDRRLRRRRCAPPAGSTCSPRCTRTATVDEASRAAGGAVDRPARAVRHRGGDGPPARVVGHRAGGDDRPQRRRVRRRLPVRRRHRWRTAWRSSRCAAGCSRRCRRGRC